jgi:hypothetical protein
MANSALFNEPNTNKKPSSPEPTPTPDEKNAAESIGFADPEGLPAMSIETLDQLLPALLEISIRQARAEGQPDLAQALQSLQLSLQAKAEQNMDFLKADDRPAKMSLE